MSKDTYSPGPNWKLVWADEFDQPTIDTNNWNHQVLPAGNFNDEWQRYTNSSKNSYIEDSCLIITAIHESDQHGMDQYSSARLNTANNQAWTYGKVAARIKLPHGMGIWPAFWMLGANIDENGGDTPWPQCGEIDIMELFGFRSDAEVEANIHYADSSGQHAQMGAVGYHLKEGIFADDFHVFELEWTSEKMIWRVDGKAYVETPITDNERTEFHQDFFILLNVAVGGAFAGRPDKTTEFPQSMYVDWVRVYQEG
ncbi:MAG: glycoside hydrolase family 16 protein [Bacteroidota bacterium]